VAGILGFTGISAASADVAHFLFYVFVVIFLVLLILGLTIFRYRRASGFSVIARILSDEAIQPLAPRIASLALAMTF
jgi:uncharacterized membrane protein YtjA (UPF0391 family)